jgi:hypothetical protein
MEEGDFFEPTVVGLLDPNYVEARLHTDGKRNVEAIRRLRDELAGTRALPVYLIVAPQEPRKILARLDGARSEAFEQLLRDGLAHRPPPSPR